MKTTAFWEHRVQRTVPRWGVLSLDAKSPRKVLALVVRWDDRARLKAAARDAVSFAFVSDVSAVLGHLREVDTRPLAVVVEPHDATGRPTAGLVRQLVTLFPDVAVIGYCRVTGETSREILDLAAAGAHELLFKGIDDEGFALFAALASANDACAAEVVYAAMEPSVPPRLRALVRHCLAHPQQSRSVQDVARALHTNRRTLVNHCASVASPRPGTLIAWCQLLLAAHLLQSPGVTVEAVAIRLNYPSATAFRNMLQRHAGLRPSEVRDRGGLPALVPLFERAMTQGAAHAETAREDVPLGA